VTEYVVIGDGAAGTTAQCIRKRDPDGRITMCRTTRTPPTERHLEAVPQV
jgi:NADPH-dependent 2,4-dienoyl-CoA reductase/sulfur reductase-like enzyme